MSRLMLMDPQRARSLANGAQYGAAERENREQSAGAIDHAPIAIVCGNQTKQTDGARRRAAGVICAAHVFTD